MAELWGMEIDWGAVSSLLTGAAAVTAAFWTVKRTERAARMEARDRKQAVAVRVVAVLEVARERLQSGAKFNEDALPWNAFAALSSDIGILGAGATRLLFYIEGRARRVEGLSKVVHTPEEVPGMLGELGQAFDELSGGIKRLYKLSRREAGPLIDS